MRNRHAITQRDQVRLLPTIIQRLVFLMPGIASWLSLRERQKYGKWSVWETEIGKSGFPLAGTDRSQPVSLVLVFSCSSVQASGVDLEHCW